MGLFCCHRFVLSSTESSSGAKAVIHSSGLATEAVASGLQPFTQYTAVLQASDADACLRLLWIWAKNQQSFSSKFAALFYRPLQAFLSRTSTAVWTDRVVSVSTGVLLRRLHFHVASVIPDCLSPSAEPAPTHRLCSRAAYVECLLGASHKAER